MFGSRSNVGRGPTDPRNIEDNRVLWDRRGKSSEKIIHKFMKSPILRCLDVVLVTTPRTVLKRAGG